MRKFIDQEMEKIKGGREEKEEDRTRGYLSPEDAALLSLPEHLRYKASFILFFASLSFYAFLKKSFMLFCFIFI